MSFEYFFCVIRAMIIGKMSYINDFLICVILAKWTIKMGRRQYNYGLYSVCLWTSAKHKNS